MPFPVERSERRRITFLNRRRSQPKPVEERRALRVEKGHLDRRKAQPRPLFRIDQVQAGVEEVKGASQALPEKGSLPIRPGSKRDRLRSRSASSE